MYVYFVFRKEKGEWSESNVRERERYLSAVNYCSSKRYHGAGVTANYIFPDRQFTRNLAREFLRNSRPNQFPNIPLPPSLLLKSNSSRIIDPHAGNHNNVLIESGEWLRLSDRITMEILSKKSNWEATIDRNSRNNNDIIIVSKLRVKVSLSLKTTSYTHAHTGEEFAYNIEPRSRAFASVNRVEAKIAERGRKWLPRVHVYRAHLCARSNRTRIVY